uniref:Uncharacterized protein n=1 Tax=Marseillevirus sp. TaxID=2809551 RepID=A0AA96J0F9_9VIRU|nr:hypothetical protein MarFTMF_076 [Marseillevirus sp.]
MSPLTPKREKSSFVLLLRVLSQCNSKEDEELLNTAKSLDVSGFIKIFGKNKKYKDALYHCAAF